MQPKNELEAEIGRLSVFDTLAIRVSSDALLLGMIRNLEEGHRASGTPLPMPFDGRDATEEVPIHIAEALVHNQKLLLEVPAQNRRTDGTRASPRHVLAESKIRELDVALQVALRASIEVHLLLNGAG
mgnify:CR=1 FL=1